MSDKTLRCASCSRLFDAVAIFCPFCRLTTLTAERDSHKERAEALNASLNHSQDAYVDLEEKLEELAAERDKAIALAQEYKDDFNEFKDEMVEALKEEKAALQTRVAELEQLVIEAKPILNSYRNSIGDDLAKGKEWSETSLLMGRMMAALAAKESGR